MTYKPELFVQGSVLFAEVINVGPSGRAVRHRTILRDWNLMDFFPSWVSVYWEPVGLLSIPPQL